MLNLFAESSELFMSEIRNSAKNLTCRWNRPASGTRLTDRYEAGGSTLCYAASPCSVKLGVITYRRKTMKLILLVTAVTIFATSLVSAQSAKQNDALEQEIRKLDSAEADAILRSDLAALEKIWVEDFTVNNPGNEISKGRAEAVKLIRAGIIKYSSFVREIETILFHGNTVVVMGLETVKPIGNAPGAGQTLRRRYTNIWMKKKGKWLLTARHANVICQS